MGGERPRRTPWNSCRPQFDIDTLVRAGAIKPGAYVEGNLNLPSCDDELAIEFESSATNPRNSWLRLRYAIRDYWTGEQHQIDDKIYQTPSYPWFGGQRWWFVCPNENRRVRKLYLPLGARRFRSRGAYRLAYASQRETVHDRAMRRARKLCRRLGDDPMDGHYPEKPPRMRGATYDRLLDMQRIASRMNGCSSSWNGWAAGHRSAPEPDRTASSRLSQCRTGRMPSRARSGKRGCTKLVLLRMSISVCFPRSVFLTDMRGKAARERKRLATGKCEGRKSHAEMDPEMVRIAKGLRRRKRGNSLRAIAAELAARGYLNANGKEFSAASVASMLGA
jgi:hypothetical protein